MTNIRLGTSALALAALTACASTGATFRSGVGDSFPEHPPFYAGKSTAEVAGDPARIGHLPVAYQRGATQAAIFDPKSGPGTPVGDLLVEMNTFLDSLTANKSVSVRLVEGGKVSAVTHAATGTPPDVQFGCATETGLAGDDCAVSGDTALGRSRQGMRLAVGRPSTEWTNWMREVMTGAGVGRALVITLETTPRLPRQTGFRGDKKLELGTGHTMDLPWLTSLETPVVVLQLTGALMDRDGQAIRIGVEGITAHRTRLLVSALGAQELISDEDVARVRTQRREDLPGQPLAWQVAIRHLVAELTGRPELGAK